MYRLLDFKLWNHMVIINQDISHNWLCCISLTSGTPSGTPSEDQAKHHEKRVIILSVIMISGFKIVTKEHLLKNKAMKFRNQVNLTTPALRTSRQSDLTSAFKRFKLKRERDWDLGYHCFTLFLLFVGSLSLLLLNWKVKNKTTKLFWIVQLF